MSQVLYRKYRPKTFEEITGQEHVVRTLKGALLNDRIGHAYLFSGPRGVGKTTMARLLAKALNCTTRKDAKKKSDGEPCNTCFSCQEINEGRSLDIIEIDGASNRGIDEIRNIKESARVAATSGNYKVFIIDEVHMLTPPAFSALLKTLEEPPAHVVFILATTEPQKITATILSRVQRFEYKKITPQQIVARLTKLADMENVKIDSDAIEAIATSAEGGLRDAESSLTKLIAFAGPSAGQSGFTRITAEHVRQILGIVPTEVNFKFLESLVKNDLKGSLAVVEELYNSGAGLDIFLKQFVAYLRFALLLKVSPEIASETSQLSDEARQQAGRLVANTENEKLIKIMNTLIGLKQELKSSPIPQLPLELAVIELTK